jgi:hypothetical protein
MPTAFVCATASQAERKPPSTGRTVGRRLLDCTNSARTCGEPGGRITPEAVMPARLPLRGATGNAPPAPGPRPRCLRRPRVRLTRTASQSSIRPRTSTPSLSPICPRLTIRRNVVRFDRTPALLNAQYFCFGGDEQSGHRSGVLGLVQLGSVVRSATDACTPSGSLPSAPAVLLRVPRAGCAPPLLDARGAGSSRSAVVRPGPRRRSHQCARACGWALWPIIFPTSDSGVLWSAR